MRLKILIGAGMLTAITVAGALAHGGATGIVKQRMDAMVTIGKATKSLAEMMRGKTAYDASSVRDAAAKIKTHAGQAMTSLFPEGSDEKVSEAKPEIWTDWEEFQVLAERLAVLAEGLELAAQNGPADGGGGNSTMTELPTVTELASMPATTVFDMLGRTCSACHQKFRLKKD